MISRELGESAASAMNESGRPLFDTYSGDLDRLRRDLDQAESELRSELVHEAASWWRTGVPFLDALVDHLVFVQRGLAQAQTRGLQGLAALEWAEYLSWPECWRRAGTPWRRALLTHYAFEDPSCGWQRLLLARDPEDRAGVGPPRNALNWYPTELQFGPYPALSVGGRRWAAKLHVGVLEAHLAYDPWTTPDAVSPSRRLDPQLTWTLRVNALRKYGTALHAAQVVIDQPRHDAPADIVRRLVALADEQAGQLRAADPPLPAPVAHAWRKTVAWLRQAATDLRGVRTSRQRAMALERALHLPLERAFIPLDVLPEDLPPAWFGVLLGFALMRRGVLSRRESDRVWASAEALVGHWQESKFPRRALGPGAAGRIVDRLARMHRLLQGKSLFAYLAKASREAWDEVKRVSDADAGIVGPEPGDRRREDQDPEQGAPPH